MITKNPTIDRPDTLTKVGKRAVLGGYPIVDGRYIYDKATFSKVKTYSIPNLIGDTFGEWTVLAYDILRSSDKRKDGSTVGSYFLCECSCGNKSSVHGSTLQIGKTTRCSSCGSKPRGNGKSSVYIFHTITIDNLYKIGVSRNVTTRLNSLLTQSPVPLELVYKRAFSTREDSVFMEKILHEMLATFNSHGEWFCLSDIQVRSVINIIKHAPLNGSNSKQE